MRIEKPSTIPFTKQIRIPLKDKAVYIGIKSVSPMDKIINIASKNNTGLFVSADVFILNSSEKIKEELKESNIDFEEVADVI